MNRKIDNFNKAFQRLKKAAEEAKTDIEIDGVIKRFEFTFEMAWKTIKHVLENEGIHCLSPKSCIKEAFSAGLIDNESAWLSMLHDRNLSVHIYNEKTSREIFSRIKETYLNELEKILFKIVKN